ncbi:Transcriptional regulator, contains XRE-family HTH domain [Evansella caseinilytica]|uniref:Transcriptional regulator, contains XRE-family HTH domain n=1 Tax=Evansella caseinilytica TaxID=1503961 RepID=A0A1H3IDA4_9BACI|nr:helix-turn-helix transcriptional regulator [Evansella caseinilytica]SDY25239.1 Transcriptional regulator, contains XRE-family HTH domain [Evansella caseinilytica]
MEIGTRIRNIRLSKQMKLTEVARKANISQSYLSDIEKGRTIPSIEKLLAICSVLHISPGDFFGQSAPLPPDMLLLLENMKRLTPAERKYLNTFIAEMLKRNE